MIEKAYRAWYEIKVDTSKLWDVIIEMVDSRTVRLFQAIMYFWFFVPGVYAAFFSEPVSIVDKAMGNAVYAVWVWLNILCPIIVAAGCWMAYHPSKELTKRVTNGLLLQTVGDFAMALTLSAYWVATLHSSWWGKGTYAMFGYVGLSMCALLLFIGDVRKLIKRSEWSRNGI